MSKLGFSMCWAALRDASLEEIRDRGIQPEMLRGEARRVFEFIQRHFVDYGTFPKYETVLEECDVDPEFEFTVEEPVGFYADKVLDRHALNAQKKAAKPLGEAIRERDPHKVHETAKDIVQAGLIHLPSERESVVNLRENATTRWERYQALKEVQDGILGIRSPWPRLDAETGGWQPGVLVTIVARLGLGKTFCALVNQVQAELQGKRVGFVSPEMTLRELELRRDAIRYRLPFRDFRRGELDAETERQYFEALAAVENSDDPDVFVSAQGFSTSVVDVEIFARDRQLDILFVDGTYLLDPPKADGRMPWHERVMHVIKYLKQLALNMEIPVITTAQFNRSVRTGSMRAGSEAIGHTDAIGQFSDIILGLFQDENLRMERQMSLRALKIRNASPIELLINWDFVRMDFSETDRDPTELGDPEEDDGFGETLF